MKALVLAIGLLVGITQVCVAEEYLYWYVDQTDLPEEDRVQFDVMMLNVYEEKDGVMSKVDIPEDVWIGDAWAYSLDEPRYGTPDTTVETRIGEYADKEGVSSYYFQLELWNTKVSEDYPPVVWTSKLLVSYESLVESRLDKDKPYTSPVYWNATGPAPIPEPTGGTLALLGLALLGLRRKRFGMSEAAT